MKLPLTLVDVPLLEVPDALARILPPEAYKKIPYTKVKDADGKEREMTDIKPAYFIEIMNRLFGPAGYGWRYEYDEMSSNYDADLFKGKGGWNVTVTNLRLYYKYTIVGDDEILESEGVVASGGVTMNKREHAERGAITNALGSAGSKMGFQKWTYMGKVHHENCKSAYEHQEKQDSEILEEGGRLPGTPLK